jgi:hypothetical protein
MGLVVHCVEDEGGLAGAGYSGDDGQACTKLNIHVIQVVLCCPSHIDLHRI